MVLYAADRALSLKLLGAGFMFLASLDPFLTDLIMRAKCAVSKA